jgi:hypothetical protein
MTLLIIGLSIVAVTTIGLIVSHDPNHVEFDEATEYKENLNKERKESLKEKGVFVDDKEFEEASKEMKSAKDGIKPVEVAPIQENKDFNKKGLFGGDNIGGGNKDYLGKRKFMTEPNTEVEREIRDVLDSSDNKDDKLSGIAALKEKYEGNKVNLAALDKLEQEIEQEDTDEGLQQQLTTELEDEYTMFGNEPEEALEILKEKYANDDRKLAILDKIAATATKPADVQGSASNPMTSATQGIKPVENNDAQEEPIVEVINKNNKSFIAKGDKFDGYDDIRNQEVAKIPEELVKNTPEFSFEEVFGKDEATPLSYYTDDFAKKGLQYFVLKDKNGNKFLVDTQGYKYSRYYAPIKASGAATKPDETKSRYAKAKNYTKTLEKVGNKAIEFLSNDEDKDIAEELLGNYFQSGEGSIYSMLQGIERDYPNDKVKQVARKFGNTISAAQKELGVSSFDDED